MVVKGGHWLCRPITAGSLFQSFRAFTESALSSLASNKWRILLSFWLRAAAVLFWDSASWDCRMSKANATFQLHIILQVLLSQGELLKKKKKHPKYLLPYSTCTVRAISLFKAFQSKSEIKKKQEIFCVPMFISWIMKEICLSIHVSNNLYT